MYTAYFQVYDVLLTEMYTQSFSSVDTFVSLQVVVGTEEGYLFLCNVSTGKILYKFMGWGSPIRCCTSSPALDVVAIGCADGKVHLHNLRFDECVVTFNHMTRGSVTAVSFRTGNLSLLICFKTMNLHKTP